MARKPRYIALASILRKRISKGTYKVGAQLPTEHQICDQHNVSRHTTRAALQVLEDEGLIERRPGLGTTVISSGAATAFSQPLGGLDDLLQYAHEAQLETQSTELVTLSQGLARRFSGARGSRWLAIYGVRAVNGKPIAATTIYVSDIIKARARDFKDPAKAITEHIEARHGVSVASITQTITAEIISEDDAAALNASRALPVLRTIRRYYDAAERLFVISDTRHPAGDFKYEMTYKRAVSPK